MDDVNVVDGLEAVRHRRGDTHGLGRGDRSGLNPGLQVPAGDAFHHDAEAVTFGNQIVNPNHVRVVYPAKNVPFLDEPGHGLGVRRKLRAEDLDRKLLTVSCRTCEHHTHGAAAELFPEEVLRSELILFCCVFAFHKIHRFVHTPSLVRARRGVCRLADTTPPGSSQ